MKRIWRENNLSIVVFGIFLLLWVGQALTGWANFNEDQLDHRQQTVTLGRYLGTGHFLEATAENWESEFLQMGAYVLLTVFLRQKGSAESKSLDGEEAVDEDPRKYVDRPDVPGPVKLGGLALKLYENSLCLALFGLFALSFLAHAAGGAREYSQDQVLHGGHSVSVLEYLGTSQFWFESLQNWQSEFLAVFSIVVLSIFLRQKGSPESKPVAAPHSATGEA